METKAPPATTLPAVRPSLTQSKSVGAGYEAMVGGITTYMREYFEFPDFCNKVAEAFRQRGFISKRDLNRLFFRNMRMGFELDRVVDQLKKQGLIEVAQRIPSTGGPVAEGWRSVE